MVNPPLAILAPGARCRSPRLDLGAWRTTDADAIRDLRARAPDVDALFPGTHELLADVLTDWRTDFGRRDRNLELAARPRRPAPPREADESRDLRDPDVIGGASLHRRLAEPGFALQVWIDPDERRRGLGTELAGAALRLAFEHLSAPSVRCAANPTLGEEVRRWAARLGFWSAADAIPRIDAFDFPKSLAATVPLEIFDARGRPVPSATAPLDR